MTTLEELLKTVMRTRANDPGAIAVFTDCLLEHTPDFGESLKVRVKFRVRQGVVILKNSTSGSKVCASVNMLKVSVFHIRPEPHPNRWGRVDSGVRTRFGWAPVGDPAIIEVIRDACQIFRS